jgi:hypothetical protein
MAMQSSSPGPAALSHTFLGVRMAMHPILVLTNPYIWNHEYFSELSVQRDDPMLCAYVKSHCVYLLVKII